MRRGKRLFGQHTRLFGISLEDVDRHLLATHFSRSRTTALRRAFAEANRPVLAGYPMASGSRLITMFRKFTSLSSPTFTLTGSAIVSLIRERDANSIN